MSYRRSLSFSEQEKELLQYFDTNGKSDIAKIALEFYRKYKDKVIPDGFIEMLRLIKTSETPKNTQDFKSNLQKLIK
jgi:hypothetical protein